MATVNYKDEIERSTEILKVYRKSKELFANEENILILEQERYRLYRSQIHDYLAPQKNQVAEQEIQDRVKEIVKYDLPICRIKIERFKNAIPIYERKKDVKGVNLCYKYLQEWLDLYELNYALVSFRSLEHFALFMEWEKPDNEKVWTLSNDPYNDGGYTGVTKPFFYNFNRMVLKKDIKFISKQMFTGGGKCLIPTTKIMTPIGTKMLKDIEVGDYVYSMKDNKLCERQVLNKWHTKKKQITITTRGGVAITVSPEHRLYTQRGYIEAKEINQSDYLYRVCAKHEYKNQTIVNNDELIFVSCMLFDGHCKSPNYTFTKMPNTEIAKEFNRACNNLGINLTAYSKNATNCLTYRVWQNGHIANEIMKRYDIDGKLSKEKRLPKQFFNMSLTQKYNFIGLMLATDGYILDNDTGITTASKGLAYDIMELLDTCGIYSDIGYKKSKCNGKNFDSWRITIPNEYLKIIFENCYCYDKQNKLVEIYNYCKDVSYCNNTNYPKSLFIDKKDFRKYVRTQWNRNKTFKRYIVENFNNKTGSLEDIVYKDFIWEQVKSIEYNETKVDMIDIEVEETHNFIANHIVSHNSYSNAVAISWLLGIDQNNDILDVLGNPTLVLTNARGIVNIMINPRFAKVFPNFQKFHDMGGDVTRNMFSVCRLKEGELTLADSTKTLNVKIISKDTSIDGIRVRYLFLDDICRSKDANNLKQHQIDINNFWNSWYKRNYGTDDFYIIISGTAYSVNDIMSHLIAYFTKGKMQRTKENKYTYQSLDGTSIIIKIPKIDDDLNRSTFPQKFPYKDALEARDRDYNTFMAMEQQQPQNPETSPLCWEKINTYSELPSGLTDYAYAVLDPARTGKNYVSMPIKRMKDEVDKYNTKVKKHYLVDCVFQLKQMADLYSEICDKVEQHHIIRLHIENNTDTSLKFLIEKLLLERGITFCVVSESFSTENKEEKIRELVYSNEGYFKNQMVYPEMQLYAPSSQMGKYMLYFTSYDYYQKMEYDDSIDSECMYIEKFVSQNNGINKAVILKV